MSHSSGVCGCKRILAGTFCAFLLAIVGARAESASPVSLQQQHLDDLKAMRKELERELREHDARIMRKYDARIGELEAELKSQKAATAKLASRQVAQPASVAEPPEPRAVATNEIRVPSPVPAKVPKPDNETSNSWGRYEPGKGFVVSRGDLGEISLGIVTYARYLNQLGLNPTYADSFGRMFAIDRRQDVMLNKVSMSFKGWLFDPDFTYETFVWTQNSSQGLGAQVEVAGHLSYRLDDYLRLSTGVAPLPTTRSTDWTYPMWLRNDNRTLADEYFRGNFTFGVWADGMLRNDLGYRLMVGNNLNQIGVDASQLDSRFSTVSGVVWWMPTTGEYGKALGFGDLEDHQKLATLLSVHFTYSPEDKQEQAGVNAFENSQVRLSDGTLLFSPNAFDTGGEIDKANYQMLDLDGGLKYRGWSLEGEYYMRWLNDFTTTGFIPVSSVFDEGFQLQASTMLIQKELQLYATASQVFGEYGNPWDAGAGFNWYPFGRHEIRVNTQASYIYRSPVGNLSIIYQVGGTGFIFNTDVIVAF